METPVEKIPTLAELYSKLGLFIVNLSRFEIARGKAINEARQNVGQDPSKIKGDLKARLQIWAELASRLPENQSQIETISMVQI